MNQSDLLLGLVADVKLFYCEPEERAYAHLEVQEHVEIWPIRSRAFKDWLRAKYFLHVGKGASTQVVQTVVDAMESNARFQGYPRDETYLRVAGDDATIYVDLANARWEVVKITADGWEILPESPIRFRRPRGMKALPTPSRNGDLFQLRDFVNAPDAATWMKIAAWMMSAFRAHGPYAPLALFGEQGAAKTTSATVLKRLIDPGKGMVRAEPRDTRDLAIAANNGRVLAFDNVSHLPGWLSDALCRLSTGGGFSTRQLYEDADEVIFDATRPLIINAIEEIMHRPDLLDRAVIVTLPRIPEERRRPESAFWPAFEAAAPAILGGLLDAVATAIRRHPHVTVPQRLPRMADFVLWGMAAAPALGMDEDQFLTMYRESRLTAHETAVELSPIGPALRVLAETVWCGTASELLERLSRDVPESSRRAKDWPATGRALAGALRRLQPPLRALGVEVEFRDERELGARRRQIVLRREETHRSHRSDGSDGDLQDGLAFPGNGTSFPGRPDLLLGNAGPHPGNDAGTMETPIGNARNDGNDEFPFFHSEGCDCRRCLP